MSRRSRHSRIAGTHVTVFLVVFCASLAVAVVPDPNSDAPAPTSLPAEPSAESAAVQEHESVGEQRTLVTLVNYLNDPSEPYTTSEIDWEILDEANPKSSASYVREVSYGRAWLTGSVEGWFSMDYADTDCDVWMTSGTLQLIAALDPFIDFSVVDRWIVVIPYNSSCGFSGISTLGKETYNTDDGTVRMSRVILNGANQHPNYVAAHELGHSFAALQHAKDYECGDIVVEDDCNPTDLGTITDRFDIMGHTWLGGHHSPPNKEQLDWLIDIIDVAPPGGTFTLVPYELDLPGTKVLRFPVDWILEDLYGTTNYYVSFRRPIGFDDTFPELMDSGAMIHMDARRYVGGTYGRSRLLDMTPHEDPSASDQNSDSSFVTLLVGETFTDTGHGITISAVGVSIDGLEVSVTIDKYCGNGVADVSIGETCDGTDLQGQSCTALGFQAGILECTPDCELDTSRCGTARCGPGHAFEGTGETCTAQIVSDFEDGNLWRSGTTWEAAREGTTALGEHNTDRIFLLIRHRVDEFTWIYRDTLPFDTSSVPENQTLLSGELSFKVLSSPSIVNTHPTLGDQLVLVQTTLQDPPGFVREDFDQFGALNSPVEGAPRIDVGDSVLPGAFSTFQLNSSGLSWIDTEGWTTLGIRGGYDVDDIKVMGEENELNLSFRSSESPIRGPELTVTYEGAALPPGGAAGAVPDGSVVPGQQLELDRISASEISLTWGPSCRSSDTDYEIYVGTLGDFSSHVPILCSTAGATNRTLTMPVGDSYYLVVPRTADREGSYGRDGEVVERPLGPESCLVREVGTCD